MSSKIMVGLLVSAAVGLGATAVSADENARAEYDHQKPAVIHDEKGRQDDFCKVPIKIKGEKVVLFADERDVKINSKVIFNRHNYKRYLYVSCNFKDKVDFYYYNEIRKNGFKCNYNNNYKLTTNNSKVFVDFDRKWGQKGHYKSRPKHVVAKVHLECVFQLPGNPRDHDNKNHHDNNNKNHDDKEY